MATVLERVKKVTVEQLRGRRRGSHPAGNFIEDLGADSLDLVELIMAFEEEFSTPESKT